MSEDLIVVPVKVAQFGVHPIARAYPPFTKRAFEELRQDLETNGQRDPVLIWDGQIIDGAHRALALSMLGRDVRVEQFIGPLEEAWKIAFSKNIVRRHLTTVQKAELILEQRARLKEAGGGVGKKATLAQLARGAGVTERTVQKVANVRRSADQTVVEAMRKEDISIDTAEMIAKLNPEEQPRQLEKALAPRTSTRTPSRGEQKAADICTIFDEAITVLIEGDWQIEELSPLIEKNAEAFVNELSDTIGLLVGLKRQADEWRQQKMLGRERRRAPPSA